MAMMAILCKKMLVVGNAPPSCRPCPGPKAHMAKELVCVRSTSYGADGVILPHMTTGENGIWRGWHQGPGPRPS